VLLGDSILDNGAYTHGAPDVVTHLRGLVPDDTSATLLAVDGTDTTRLAAQVARLPADATDAVVSLGGNDALLDAHLLDHPITSTRDALAIFGDRIAAFEGRFRAAIAAVAARVPRTIVCTIYDPPLSRDEVALARVGLMLFNDAILRVAFESGLAVIDLRLVCVAPEDFANPLEPSTRGAAKIARAIADALGLADGAEPVSSVFGAADRP
jgi:hypothetical protein